MSVELSGHDPKLLEIVHRLQTEPGAPEQAAKELFEIHLWDDRLQEVIESTTALAGDREVTGSTRRVAFALKQAAIGRKSGATRQEVERGLRAMMRLEAGY